LYRRRPLGCVDTPRAGGEQSEIPYLLPTGEELVDSAGEDSSRLERLRRYVDEESDDEIHVLEKDMNVVHDVFSHPPTSSYGGTRASLTYTQRRAQELMPRVRSRPYSRSGW
jgi:hypothetical protein